MNEWRTVERVRLEVTQNRFGVNGYRLSYENKIVRHKKYIYKLNKQYASGGVLFISVTTLLFRYDLLQSLGDCDARSFHFHFEPVAARFRLAGPCHHVTKATTYALSTHSKLLQRTGLGQSI